MSLTLTYKNELGTVSMQGGGNSSPLRITAIEGLGLVSREYNVAIYSGYDGQETLGSRAAARTITIALEVNGRNAVIELRSALHIFSRAGMLYIKNDDIDRRIKCNQVHAPDITRVIRGEVATFVVQLVCDSPFFEDSADTSEALYKREKILKTPFELPTMLTRGTLGATINVLGAIPVEPIITMRYPKALAGVESVIITNESTGAAIRLDYAPKNNDTVMIDIKNRKITSSVQGNIINNLSGESFLGDFVLVPGLNILSVDLGDVTLDFTIECKYNNLYNEAVIV